MPRELLITGSTIGQALAQAFAADPSIGHVHLTYHGRPPAIETDTRITLHQLDLLSEDDIADLFRQLAALDGVINCAGFLHSGSISPEKSVRQVTAESFSASMLINALPTALLAKHAAPLLRKSTASVFATVTAKVGSIEDNRLGGWYSYRASKAACNMLLKTLSIEWQHALPRCTVAALHPGTVASALSDPFTKNIPDNRLFSPQESALHLKAVIDALTPASTGKFWAWDGQEIPW